MPRIKEYNPPAELSRLPAKTTITRGDKLALLMALRHRAETSLMVGTDRLTFAAIIADVRASGRPAHKDSAPVRPEAPSNPVERKIETASGIVHLNLNLKRDDEGTNIVTLTAHVPDLSAPFTEDEARQIRDALAELVDDVRRDAIARAWSQDLLAATTE